MKKVIKRFFKGLKCSLIIYHNIIEIIEVNFTFDLFRKTDCNYQIFLPNIIRSKIND